MERDIQVLRAELTPAPEERNKMTRLLFIRHGQSVANREDRFAGHSDFELTELGHKQAELAAAYIREHFPTIDAIYASDLKRAYSTALPCALEYGLDVHADAALREIYAGEWEALTFGEIIRRYPAEFTLWRTDFGHAFCPGGESVVQLSRRICDEVLRIASLFDGKTVLIATHATPIRAIECAARALEPEQMGLVGFVGNASLNIFDVDGGKFTAVRTNINEYLAGFETYLPKSLEQN